ncbi:hypothetical protein ACWENQ_34505 [Nonomuraea sp. NPDC004354]
MAATAPTAVVGGTNAAGAGLSVMVAGGCNGADPAPTLARFQQEVRGGKDPLFRRRHGAERPHRWRRGCQDDRPGCGRAAPRAVGAASPCTA